MLSTVILFALIVFNVVNSLLLLEFYIHSACCNKNTSCKIINMNCSGSFAVAKLSPPLRTCSKKATLKCRFFGGERGI